MNRYLLFKVNLLAPHGGWGDFVKSSNDLELLLHLAEDLYEPYVSIHIVDMETETFVYEK